MIDTRHWQRIESREQFIGCFADRTLHGDGMIFTIHSNGLITGSVGGAALSGDWAWEGGMFCRHASLDGEDLGIDFEVIEQSGLLMRYTRNAGRGTMSIVTLDPP